jgi:hypothetical protein
MLQDRLIPALRWAETPVPSEVLLIRRSQVRALVGPPVQIKRSQSLEAAL